MRIAWITTGIGAKGGAEFYVSETARLLAARGHENVLFHDVSQRAPLPGAFAGSFPVVDLEYQLRQAAPDVTYVHQVGDASWIDAAAAAPAPAFRFLHDHAPFCLREHKFTTWKKTPCTRTAGVGCYACLGFARRQQGRIRLRSLGSLRRDLRRHRRLDGIVVASRYLAGHAEAHGLDPARIHVAPLFASLPLPAVSGPRRDDLLVFVGALTRGKALDVLLAALERTRSRPNLLVVGRGPQADAYRRAGRALAERVAFQDAASRPELAALLSRATCTVLCSRTPETFGLVGVESLASGTPVIGTRVGAIPEWLEHGRTGLLVEPNDPASLAAAVDRIVEHPRQARAMGEQAVQAAQARFTPARHVETLLELFATACGRRALTVAG
jgi:glycosyltransferase involved in cell wall biosynthesis